MRIAPPHMRYSDQHRWNVIDDRMAVSDLAHMVLAEVVGVGTYRTVYDTPLNPDWVIKVESADTSSNCREWEIWQDVRYSEMDELKAWLAPCILLSGCGKFLIQRKTTKAITYPEKVPRALFDLKLDNFGMMDGRFVCHDYASVPLVSDPQAARLKKVKWRTGDTPLHS